MSFRQFSSKSVLNVGDNVVWVDNSSWHAHQHKILFHIESMYRKNIQVSDIRAMAYDRYILTGVILYQQCDGVWHKSSGPVTVTYYYNNTVGGGFPAVIKQDVDKYIQTQLERQTRK